MKQMINLMDRCINKWKDANGNLRCISGKLSSTQQVEIHIITMSQLPKSHGMCRMHS